LIFDRSTLAKQAPEVWPLCGHRKEQVKDFAFVVRRRASGSRRRPTNGSRLREGRSPKYRRALRRINRLTRSWWVAVNLGRLKLHCGTVGHSRPINEHRTGHLRELGFLRRFARNCQDLWIGVFQATSVPVVAAVWSAGWGGVISVGRSSSLPLWKVAPARTRATRWGALTARQRAWAASMSL